MKKPLIISIIVIILLALGIGAYFLFRERVNEQFLEIFHLYNADGNIITSYKISPTKAVVGGVEGVKYISLKITVTNLDIVPLNLVVDSLTPSEAISAKPSNQITVQPDESGSWTTGLIDIEPYVGTTQEFCVTVKSLAIASLREESIIDGCTSITIDPNPVGEFDVVVDSGIGDGTINPSCTESWTCTEWGTCSNNIQTRACTDSNNCGTTNNKPTLSQNCATTPVAIECTPENVGIRRCFSATKYQKCMSSGSWSGLLSCSNACTGAGVCS